MIIIINKVKFYGKRFCEKFVTGSISVIFQKVL